MRPYNYVAIPLYERFHLINGTSHGASVSSHQILNFILNYETEKWRKSWKFPKKKKDEGNDEFSLNVRSIDYFRKKIQSVIDWFGNEPICVVYERFFGLWVLSFEFRLVKVYYVSNKCLNDSHLRISRALNHCVSDWKQNVSNGRKKNQIIDSHHNKWNMIQIIYG